MRRRAQHKNKILTSTPSPRPLLRTRPSLPTQSDAFCRCPPAKLSSFLFSLSWFMASEASFIYILSHRRKNQERRKEKCAVGGRGSGLMNGWRGKDRRPAGDSSGGKSKKKREGRKTASFSSDNGSICLLEEWAERSDCFIKGRPRPIWFQCIWRRHRRRLPCSFFVQFSAGSVSPSAWKPGGGAKTGPAVSFL